jgi:hypothetical protein
MQKITLEQYLEKISSFTDSPYGNIIRGSFKDIKGGSELAMLAAPTKNELQQLEKAVAIMTPTEKADSDKLTDEQIQKIAADAKIDAGLLAIFLNGYALELRKT